jgi:tetratricopeptide (TPR) repeat protein
MPFVPIPDARLRALRDSLIRGLPPTPAAHLETSHLANLHEGVHAELQQYLAAGLSLRMGDEAMARTYLQRLERPRPNPLAASLAQDAAASIRAQMALGAGRPAEAATALEQVQRMEARVGLIGGSPFYSQGLERYLYAGIMEKQGRFEDALRWYSSFSSNSIFDFVFLAPAQVHRGRMLERLGRAREAADQYRSALELYQDSDTEFGPIVKEAREGLARLTVAAPARRSAVPVIPGISTTQWEGRTIASRQDRSPARRTAR